MPRSSLIDSVSPSSYVGDSDDDLNALLQLRRIATGEEFEADTISATMTKDRSLQEGILSVQTNGLLRFVSSLNRMPTRRDLRNQSFRWKTGF